MPRQCRSRFRHSTLHFFGLTKPRVNDPLFGRCGRDYRLRGIVKEYRTLNKMTVLRLWNSTMRAQRRFPYGDVSGGGNKGIRALDPLLAKQVLSQLSYAPTKAGYTRRVSYTNWSSPYCLTSRSRCSGMVLASFCVMSSRVTSVSLTPAACRTSYRFEGPVPS